MRKRILFHVAIYAAILIVGYAAISRLFGTVNQVHGNMKAIETNMYDIAKRVGLLENMIGRDINTINETLISMRRTVGSLEKKLEEHLAQGEPEREFPEEPERFRLYPQQAGPWDTEYTTDVEGNPFAINDEVMDEFFMNKYRREIKQANQKIGDGIENAFKSAESQIARPLTIGEKNKIVAETEPLQKQLFDAYAEQAYARGEVRSVIVGTNDTEGDSRIGGSYTIEAPLDPNRKAESFKLNDLPPNARVSLIPTKRGGVSLSISLEEFPVFKEETPDIIEARRSLTDAIVTAAAKLNQ